MNNLKRLISSCAITVVLAGFSGAVLAEGEGDTDLASIGCKEVMLFTSEHRDVAVAFLHGYLTGKAGKTTFNSEVLAGRTDAFLNYCLDHPTAKALDSMMKASK